MAERMPSVQKVDGCLPNVLGGISKHGPGRGVAVTINTKNGKMGAIEELAREGGGRARGKQIQREARWATGGKISGGHG